MATMNELPVGAIVYLSKSRTRLRKEQGYSLKEGCKRAFGMVVDRFEGQVCLSSIDMGPYHFGPTSSWEWPQSLTPDARTFD